MSTYLSSSKSLEKITLKPKIQELLLKPEDKNYNFDVLAYTGSNPQENKLGALMILGNIANENEEDVGYIVNLVLSLGKREFYSKQSLIEQDSRLSFERTLKKINEVLENFFNSKEMQLDVGIAVLTGEKLLISRIGRLKVGLARRDDYVDVINNIELFSKDNKDNQQFSNIISGDIKAGDKLFVYIPFKSLTYREKIIKNALLEYDQDNFTEKINSFSSKNPSFACCGVHIALQEIKELPLEPMVMPKIISAFDVDLEIDNNNNKTINDNRSPINKGSIKTINNYTLSPSHLSSMIPTGISVGKKTNLRDYSIRQFDKIRIFSFMSTPKRLKIFLFIALIIIVPVAGFALYKSDIYVGESNEYKTASENKKLAEARISQQNSKEARNLLYAAITSLSNQKGKKVDDLKSSIEQMLANINKENTKKPELYADLNKLFENKKFAKIASNKTNPIIISSDGDVLELSNAGFSEVFKVKTNPKFIFISEYNISIFDGLKTFSSYSKKNKDISNNSLSEERQTKSAAIFNDSLYTLLDGGIYKFASPLQNNAKSSLWSSVTDTNAKSIAIDGNIYLLNSTGSLSTYFKGKKSTDFDLQTNFSSKTSLITKEDSPLITVADFDNKAIFSFTKANGTLQESYNLRGIGSIEDISLGDSNIFWILTTDNKVWKL